MFGGMHSLNRRRSTAALVVGGWLVSAAGCSLIPTRDDLSSAAKTVKDTVTGKAARDRRNQAFAEARIMERRKDYAGAQKLYRELLAELPRNRDCMHRLAVIASMQGKYDEAITLYRQALDCGEPTPDLWSDLGYCHYLQQQMPEAEGALRQALAAAPQHRAALNNLALVVGESGRLDESYDLFRRANSEAEAEANFAFLLAQCGDYARSQEHYSRALSLDSEMRPAVDGLIQVTGRMQQQRDAQLAQTGAPPPPAPGGVVGQQVAYNAPTGAPAQRPLIEVFTGGPPRMSNSTVGSIAAAQAAGPTTPDTRRYDPANNAPSAAPPQQPAAQPLPSVGGPATAWNNLGGAPAPFSFPQQTPPAYLQPSDQSRVSQGSGAATGGAPSSGGLNFPPLR